MEDEGATRDESGQFTASEEGDSEPSEANEEETDGDLSEVAREAMEEVKTFGAEKLASLNADPEDIPDDPRAEEAGDTYQAILGDLWDGEITPQDAIEELAVYLASEFDVPMVPESLEERGMKMLATLIIQAVDSVRGRVG